VSTFTTSSPGVAASHNHKILNPLKKRKKRTDPNLENSFLKSKRKCIYFMQGFISWEASLEPILHTTSEFTTTTPAFFPKRL
jgi:hypothetical protein